MLGPPRPREIYGLYDPTDPEELTRYVGYSHNAARRLKGHIYDAKKGPWTTHRLFWIRSLLRRGVKPLFRILEEAASVGADWNERERFWIATFPPGQLVNSTSGGDGTPDLCADACARIGAASKARMMGNTFRKGVTLSLEERKLISEGMDASENWTASKIWRKGRPSYVRTEETCKKNSIASTGKPRPDVSPRTIAMNKARKGKYKCITDGQKNRRILKTEPLPEGWRLGITREKHHLRGKRNKRWSLELKKQAKRKKGKMRWITDGVKTKMWMPGDKMPRGWKFGKTITCPRDENGKFIPKVK